MKIFDLKPEIRATAKRMIMSPEFTYPEIAEHISNITGECIRPVDICLYATYIKDELEAAE